MLSTTRQQALLSGVSANAQKVYGFVPIAEGWNLVQIHSEMTRKNHAMQHRVMSGCLGALVAAGLVTEPSQGHYRRVGVRTARAPAARAPVPAAPPAAPVPLQKTSPMKAATPAPTVQPIDRIGLLAARVATMATELAKLAADISDAAADAQVQMEASAEDSQKLRQLQAILKTVA